MVGITVYYCRMSASESNRTIETLLNHRTIRAFTSEPVSEEVISTLLEVARHAPTSNFYQQCTIIRIKDPKIRHVIYQSSLQPYVDGPNAELFIFVADLNRISLIRESAGKNDDPLTLSTLFLQGIEDTMIAAQSIVVAAESLGLGTCYLGSIAGEVKNVIEVLHLPKHTYPIVGLLVGHPDQAPEMKPRLPIHLTSGVDTYPVFDPKNPEFLEYNEIVEKYYDLRDNGRPLESYSKQACNKPGSGRVEQIPFLQVLHDQDLAQK